MNKKTNLGQGNLSVRVKTARKRSHASTLWLERQLNDPYVRAAKNDGYRSRAAYKIIQLDEKLGLFRSGLRVVDLGAAPGGWSQVAAKKIGADQGKGKVVAIDYLAMDPIAGVDFLEMDFTHDDAPNALMEKLAGQADIVMSDMAAPTTGHARTDHLRIMGLAEMAYDFARQVLAPKGVFIAKLFQGGAEGALLRQLKQDFTSVKHIKPAASRADSSELYIVATGFRGA